MPLEVGGTERTVVPDLLRLAARQHDRFSVLVWRIPERILSGIPSSRSWRVLLGQCTNPTSPVISHFGVVASMSLHSQRYTEITNCGYK
jgi:hypothetical protein